VVDQFEEAFRACQSEPERLAFIAALWKLADPGHAVPLGAPLGSGTGQVNAVSFSPNEKMLARRGWWWPR
jgi:hypothetical protein